MDDNTLIANGLKRRNSVPSAVIIPRKLKSSQPILPNGNHKKLTNSTTLSVEDFKLVPLEFSTAAATTTGGTSSYTSLKDMIICNSPSSMLSPTPPPNSTISGSCLSSPSFGSGYEISIRNRLVKQAAWAYLQPTVPSSPSSSSSCCSCFSGEIIRPIIARVRGFLCETVTRVYDWLMDVLWLVLCR